MDENPPPAYASYPPPPSRTSGLGCFAKGCLTVIIVAMLLGVMLGGAGWYLWRNITPFVSQTPETVRIFPATDAQYQAVQAKIAPFVQAANAGQAATLTLSADEFNTLVARDPAYAHLRGRLYLTIDHNELSADESLPINSASSGQQQVYFNGRIFFDASFAGGDFALVLRRLEPLNGGPSPSMVTWLISHPDFSRSFSRGFNESFHDALSKHNPAAEALIDRLHTIIVKDNQIVITTQASSETPVAAPATST